MGPTFSKLNQTQSVNTANRFHIMPVVEDELRKTVQQAFERQSKRCCVLEEREFLQWNGMSIDVENHQAVINGQSVDLTPSESKILRHLIRNSHRVVTKEELHDVLYPDRDPDAEDGAYETLRWHIYNLRKKIESDPSHPRYILTEYGVGYKLSESIAP